MSRPTPVFGVIIIDDDPLAVRVMARGLGAAEDMVVRGTALDAATGLVLAAHTRPDVVILDAALRSADSLALLARLRESDPAPEVLLLHRQEDDELAWHGLRAGACGFLSKSVDPASLPRIVRAIAAGEVVISRSMTTRLVARLRGLPEDAAGLRPVRSPLSNREWEVLDMLRGGGSTPAIAEELRISTETVRSHVKHILNKLGAHTRAEATARARELIEHSTA